MCVATGIVTSWKEMMIARVVTVAQVGNWMAIATAMRISPSTCGFALACIRDSRSPKRARPTAAASDRSAPRKKSTAEMMSRTIVLPFLVRGRRPLVLGVVGPRIGPGAQPLTGGIGVRIERRLLALGDLIDRGDGRGGGSGLGGALLLRFLRHVPIGVGEVGQSARLGTGRHRIGLRHVPGHADRSDEA